MDGTNLHAWDAFNEESEISTKELDELVTKYGEVRKEVDAIKIEKKKAEEKLAVIENQLLRILKFTKKKSYDVDGVGKVTLRERTSVRVPKTPEDKRKMLQHFRDLGGDIYLRYVTVNSQSLNSYVKEQLDINPLFQLPGVGDPVRTPNLSFTKR